MKDNNPYHEMLDIMQGVAQQQIPQGLYIGRVLAPPPNIKIKYKDFVLEKEEIFISEYLLVGYRRTAKGHIKSATQNKSGGGGYAEFASHNHAINNDYTDDIIYTDTLKKGEYVSIMPIIACDGYSGQYLIMDKVVHL